MEAHDAAAAVEQMQIVDVREYYEWIAGHLQASAQIPLRHLPARLEEISPDRPALLVCQVGQRSALATEFLRKRGYDAHNLEGGVEAWVAAGFSLVGEDERPGGVVDGWAQTIDF